ncbi:MAG: hypothetical protein J5I50_01835 [Chitinophagaceae bacterium]|nr:hypothetical protein [Chitinophagaceae bacterium]
MDTTNLHDDQYYVYALLVNDRTGIEEIYSRFSGKVKSFIIKNRGTVAEAAAIFKETLTELFLLTKYKNLELTCPLEPVLLLLCQRKWIKSKEEKEKLFAGVNEDIKKTVAYIEEKIKDSERYKSILSTFTPRCKELIETTFSAGDLDALAKNWKIMPDYMRGKRAECMASLINTAELLKEE